MKAKWIKRIVISLAVLIVFFALIELLAWWTDVTFKKIFVDPEKLKYGECGPEELLPEVERVCDINFPEGITGVKTAWAYTVWDSPGANPFIVRFLADPNTISWFLKSLPKDIEFTEYEPNMDDRNSYRSPIPDWFTEPIQRGKKTCVLTDSAHLEIYVDTADEKSLVVYVRGFCDLALDN